MLADVIAEKRIYRIGIIGDPESFETFVPLLKGAESGKTLSDMGLAAMVVPPEAAQAVAAFVPDGIPAYPNYQAMLSAHPEINLILELTGRRAMVAELRAALPPGVTLVEQDAARFFIYLLTSDKLWMACKLDLLHTQALLKTIIDQLHEDILFLDRSGNIVDLNRNVYTADDKTKEEYLGKHYSEVFGNEEAFSSPYDTGSPIQKTFVTGLPAEALYSNVDADGRMQYYRVYSYPVQGAEGEVLHVLAIRRDITQRMFMEQRLQQAEKLAAVGELSTFIAHEIRNPMFAISGFANSLLRQQSLDEGAREKVRIILEESKRLDGILKSILNFTRPTEARTGILDVNQVASQTMEIMGIGCQKQNIRVLLDLARDAAKAKGDSEMLKQCLINLVKNSMEAMIEGGALTVRTGMTRDYVFLEVEDTGKGIGPDLMPKVFNPFFSTKGKGAGLGLAMIKKIVDDLGGEVDLKSRVDQGTKVTLFLPPLLAVAKDAQ